MKFAQSVLVVAMGWICATPALSQSTLQDLVNLGAKSLSDSEWGQLLPVEFEYPWLNKRGTVTLEYLPNGTHSGFAAHYESRTSSRATGTWEMDGAGKLCTQEKFSNSYWNDTEFCLYLFQADDQYYVAKSDVDRSSAAGKVKIKKLK